MAGATPLGLDATAARPVDRRRGAPRGGRALGLPACLMLAALATGACTFIPSSGPRRDKVLEPTGIRTEQLNEATKVSYALLPLTPALISRLRSQDTALTFPVGGGTPDRAASGAIAVGDVLTITVFESQAGGLFSPAPEGGGGRPGNFIQLPGQQVDASGYVSVPYGGRIQAIGRSTTELQRLIERRLGNRALEPQVVVTLNERRGEGVSVVGDVLASAKFTLDPGGERILGAIARAGGPRFPAYDTVVTLQRGGQTTRAVLSEIAASPAQNLQLRSGDVVFVSNQPRYFSALGAVGQTNSLSQLVRRFPFEAARLSLQEALAKAGGLQDDRADPRAIFLYRFERRSVLESVGVQVPPELPDEIPTIYTVNYSEPSGFFLASRFLMRDLDVVFVSPAGAVELNKFTTLLLPFGQSASAFRAGFVP